MKKYKVVEANDVTHNFLKAQIRGKKVCSQDKSYLLNLITLVRRYKN
jgi:hypothetical protein